MRYNERKEFLYDGEVWNRSDTVTALKIHAEYVRTNSPKPYPKFFEVDRSEEAVDPLWHMPTTERVVFKRTLDIPAIVTFDKPNWAMTKLGITPKQHFRFWIANLHITPPGTLMDGREQAQARTAMERMGRRPVGRFMGFPSSAPAGMRRRRGPRWTAGSP